MGKKRVLLIDDDKVYRKLLKWNLESVSDLQVFLAPDGEKGLKLARRLKPDLILLDIVMPGIDGFSVLETLKRDKGMMQIPVIMLTNKTDEASKVKAAQLCTEGYIAKPVDPSYLKQKIEDVLKRSWVK